MTASSTPAVLVVDDDPALRAMLSLWLRRLGWRVVSAGSGSAALQALRDDDIGWLITDARMSPMDGFELAREAGRLRPGLRVAMISAVEPPERGRPPIEAFFPKPLQLEEVSRWLSSTGR